MIKFDPINEKFKHFRHDPKNKNSISSNIVNNIAFDKSGKLWVGTFNAGVNIFDIHSETFQNYYNSPKLKNRMRNASNITTIECDKDSIIWLGGNNSLHVLNPASLEVFLYRNSFDDQLGKKGNPHTGRISHIYEDNNGIVWVASWEKTVEKYDPNKDMFSKFFIPLNNKGQKDHINGFAKGDDNILWLSTFENGLIKSTLTGEIVDRITYPRLHDKILNHLVMDKENRIWTGGLNGIEVYSTKTNKIEAYFTPNYDDYSGIKNTNIHKFMLDSRNVLWVLTRETVVYIDLNNNTFSIEKFQHELKIEKTIDIFEDNKGNIVLCGRGGVVFYEPGAHKLTHVLHETTNPGGLSNNVINCGEQDGDGYYWFGSNNGLNRYDLATGEVKVWYEKDGLASAFVHDLEIVGEEVWFRTLKGVTQLNCSNGKIRNYSSEHGLPDKIKIVWKSPHDELYISGEAGYIRFKPSEIKDEKKAPKVVFTNLKVNGQKVPIAENSILKKHIMLTGHIEINMISEPLSSLLLHSTIHCHNTTNININ